MFGILYRYRIFNIIAISDTIIVTLTKIHIGSNHYFVFFNNSRENKHKQLYLVKTDIFVDESNTYDVVKQCSAL